MPAAWSEVRRAIADLDAKLTQERQEKIAVGVSQNLEAVTQVATELDGVARKMDKNIGVIADVQRMVHYIEIAIVSVYFAHLFHMCFAENHHTKEMLQGWFITVGVTVCALIGLVFALLLNYILHRKSGHEPPPDHPKSSAPNHLAARLDHLDLQSSAIREGLQKAVDLADIDPEMALVRVRKVLEYMIQRAFVRLIGEPPGNRPLENLIERLVKDGNLSQKLEVQTEYSSEGSAMLACITLTGRSLPPKSEM